MKPRAAMVGKRRLARRACALVLFLAGGAALAASGPYLAVIGPAALRWQPNLPSRPAALAALPPLIMTNAEPVFQATNALPPTPPAPHPKPAAPTNPEDEAAPDQVWPFDRNSFLPPPAPATANPAVPWEALIPYFSASLGTNRSSTISMPLNFNPPLVPVPPSSSATYSTTTP